MKKKIIEQCKAYFYFSSQERKGVLVLFTLLVILLVLPPFFNSPKEASLSEEGVYRLEVLVDSLKESGVKYAKKEELKGGTTIGEARFSSLKKEPKPGKNTKIHVRESFNPNTVSDKTLHAMGLPASAVANFVKYREKGGYFKSKEDVKKIYGLSKDVFQQLEPWMDVEVQREKLVPRSNRPIKKELATTNLLRIDINQALPEEWQLLKGIGPYYAGRITSFREALGGFVRVDQVAETYGVPDSVFLKIRPSLIMSPIFRKINLNECTEDELKSHPYITWKEAKLIAAYRKQHGPFTATSDLKKIKAFKADWFRRITPYLMLVDSVELSLPEAAE